MAVDKSLTEKIRNLVEEGKRTGVLTYDQIDSITANQELSAEQIDDVLQVFTDEGIKIVEKL